MRRRRRWLLIVAGPTLVLAALLYQLIEPRSHLLSPPRAANGVDYVLYAHVPEACRAGGCPALYVLDGARWISLIGRTDDALAQSHEIDPVIVVAIGYRDDIPNMMARRAHDFTPAVSPANPTSGADAYLAALRDSIIPYAEANLPIARGSRAIFGHAEGGLFVAYALAKAPDLFDGYILMCPALAAAGAAIFDTRFAASARRRIVFLATNTERDGRDCAADTRRLNTMLLARPELQVSHSILPHTSKDAMVEAAAPAALQALFGAPQ